MQTDRFAQIESALGDRWTVRRIAGSFRAGVKNGRALESLFHSPSCACSLFNGDILVCTNTDRHIRVIRSDGLVESLPSCWLKPSGLCSTEHGTAVCDAGHHRIKFLSVDGKRVTSIAGVGRKGFKDGPVTIAEFNNPCSCCYDSAGALFVVDKGNHSIRKIKDGLVITVAGKGIPGHADGGLAMFSGPSDIAYHGPTGFLFVADTGNHCIRCIQPDLSGVITVAGVPGNPGCHNGPCLDALFYFPSSIAILHVHGLESKSQDHAGMTNIVIAVADTFNNQIRRIFFDKNFVDTLVGSIAPGTADGNRSVCKFHHPSWVRSKCSVENDSYSLIVCDTENNIIREVFITEGSNVEDPRPNTPLKTHDTGIISKQSRDLKFSPIRSPVFTRQQFVSPRQENQKFDFSPRRANHARQKVAAVHSFNTQRLAVSSIYSGVTHLFQYKQGAYRYVSPCRILLSPADSDSANASLQFLEIPSDRLLSSCSLDSEVRISVQNFTFVYFTKFGIGCRFGNKNETDKFLEVLRSLSLSLCELEKPAHRFISSTSAPQSPINYAKQRLDRPFPLEVALASPALDQTKKNHLPEICQNIAHKIDDICADMMSLSSIDEYQLLHGRLNFWRERLLDCSEQLSASTLALSPFPITSSTPSLQSLSYMHAYRQIDSLNCTSTDFQVSWFLLRDNLEVSSTVHGQRSYFDVLSGEVINMKIYFRGHNYQVSFFSTFALRATFSHHARISDSAESFDFIRSQRQRRKISAC
jgi:hypothetical protein